MGQGCSGVITSCVGKDRTQRSAHTYAHTPFDGKELADLDDENAAVVLHRILSLLGCVLGMKNDANCSARARKRETGRERERRSASEGERESVPRSIALLHAFTPHSTSPTADPAFRFTPYLCHRLCVLQPCLFAPSSPAGTVPG